VLRQVELGVNLEDQHGPAAEWVAQEPNQRAIAKKFKNFLFSYGVDGNERIYYHRLRAVCRSARACHIRRTATVQHSAALASPLQAAMIIVRVNGIWDTYFCADLVTKDRDCGHPDSLQRPRGCLPILIKDPNVQHH